MTHQTLAAAGAWPVSLQTLNARLEVLETVVQRLQEDELDPALHARGAEAVQAALAATRQDLAPLADAQTTLIYDECADWHATAPIATPSRGLRPDGQEDSPFLEARIAVTGWGYTEDGRLVDGRFTKVWLDNSATTTPLTPDRAREIAAEIRDFAVRLEALAAAAERIARDDYQAGQPEARP